MLLQLLCQSIMYLAPPPHHENMEAQNMKRYTTPIKDNEHRVDAKNGSILDFPSPQVHVKFVPF